VNFTVRNFCVQEVDGIHPRSCPVAGYGSPFSDAEPSDSANAVLLELRNVISEDGERKWKIVVNTFVSVNEGTY
jgi:hypothetical protein